MSQAELRNSAISTTTPHLQIAWDSTSLGELKLCPRRYQLRILEGWSPRSQSVHLTFGIAFHSALEHFDHALGRGEDRAGALRAAIRQALKITWDQKLKRPWMSDDKYKNRATLIRTIVWYFEHYNLLHDDDSIKTVRLANGKPAVELSFRLALPYNSPADGPYLLCGHLDKVGELSGGLYVVDRKTTKHTLSPDYFRQYSPDNQFSTYIFAGQSVLERPIAGLIVDAAQVLVEGSRYQREPVSRTPDEINEWLKDLGFWLKQAEFYASQNHWPMNDKACVTGDTIVTVTRGKRKGWKMPISQLYKMTKERNGKYPFNSELETHLLSDLGGYVGNQRCLDVILNGIKPVFRIKTGSAIIKATADHKFNTPSGWKRVDQLIAGDSMFYWNSRKGLGNIESSKRDRIGKLYYYTNGSKQSNNTGLRKRKLGANERRYRLIIEADMNGLSLDEFIKILRTDEKRAKTLKYLPKGLEVHHKNEDETNDSIENLEVLTPSQHKQQHDMGQNVNKLVLTIIRSIEYVGEEAVYDIAMEHPHHNFIANGLVAHNCHVYGGCSFREVCSKSPAVREQWLKQGFEKRVWDPLAVRGDI